MTHLAKTDIRIDIAADLGLDRPRELAATLFLPDRGTIPERPIVIFAVPGLGYSRHYYDLAFPGHTGYSEAERHRAAGVLFIALDHLGVGESTIPETPLDFPTMASAYNAAVRILRARIVEGTLVEGFPPLKNVFAVGLGQSMGAAITVSAQALHRTFDAIGLLGYSVIQIVLSKRPTPGGVFDADQSGDSDLTYAFHWDETPPELIAADLGGGYPKRKVNPRFGSATFPACAPELLEPAPLAKLAAMIDVPVLLAFGARDVSANPHDEAAMFPASSYVALTIVPRMAHMHNFAPTREILWARTTAWARLQADEKH